MKSNAFGKLKFKYFPLLATSFLILALVPFFLFNLTQQSSSLELVTDKDLAADIFENKNYLNFEKYAKQKGVEQAYKVLKEQFPANEAEAHDFAHIIGFEALKQEGLAGINICDTAFNYGCYHGFIEVYLEKNGVAAVKEIEKSCIKLGYIHSPSCLHGIGHGLMINSSYELQQALSDCDRLIESSRIYCWDGVFMERITGSMLNTDSRPIITKTNLLEPCISIEKIYKGQCWRNQVSLWYSYYQANSSKVAKECSTIEPEFHQLCYESIGLLNVTIAQEDREKLINLCNLQDEEASNYCFLGEIKELLFEGKSPQLAENLCLHVTDSTRQNCYSVFNNHYNQSKSRFKT